MALYPDGFNIMKLEQTKLGGVLTEAKLWAGTGDAK